MDFSRASSSFMLNICFSTVASRPFVSYSFLSAKFELSGSTFSLKREVEEQKSFLTLKSGETVPLLPAVGLPTTGLATAGPLIEPVELADRVDPTGGLVAKPFEPTNGLLVTPPADRVVGPVRD